MEGVCFDLLFEGTHPIFIEWLFLFGFPCMYVYTLNICVVFGLCLAILLQHLIVLLVVGCHDSTNIDRVFTIQLAKLGSRAPPYGPTPFDFISRLVMDPDVMADDG